MKKSERTVSRKREESGRNRVRKNTVSVLDEGNERCRVLYHVMPTHNARCLKCPLHSGPTTDLVLEVESSTFLKE